MGHLHFDLAGLYWCDRSAPERPVGFMRVFVHTYKRPFPQLGATQISIPTFFPSLRFGGREQRFP